MLILNKTEFKVQNNQRGKMAILHTAERKKENIITKHMQEPKNIISKYIKEQWKELEGEMHNYSWGMSQVYFRNWDIKQTKIIKM